MERKKSMTYERNNKDTLRESAGHLQNDVRTCEPRDTTVTHAGSLDVHALPQTIAALTAMRTRYGATSAIGHACSNLLEQIAILPSYVRPEWASHEMQTLPWLMNEQIRNLAELTGGMQ